MRRTVPIRNIQALQRTHALLTHLAPRPAALHHRLAACVQPRPHSVCPERTQLLLLRREVGFACLQLRLCYRQLVSDLHFGLRNAQ